MKRNWTPDELMDVWTLHPSELEMINQARTDKNRLGLALLLKWFQYESRFPTRPQDVPPHVLKFLARQLAISPDVLKQYTWQGRTIARHRVLVRTYLGFRETTIEDGDNLTQWLVEFVLAQERREDALQEALYNRCREQQLEPPTPLRIERIIRSAVRTPERLGGWMYAPLLAVNVPVAGIGVASDIPVAVLSVAAAPAVAAPVAIVPAKLMPKPRPVQAGRSNTR